MKKVLLVDASHRKGANSEVIVDTIAEDLVGHIVKVFKIREQNCQFCMACDNCQRRKELFCVRKDAITDLLPFIDTCDSILIASPVYDHQVSAMAKMFIERFYAFYDPGRKSNSRVPKPGKKAALLLSCYTGPQDEYKRYADWTLEGFWQIGASDTRSEVFGMIRNRSEIIKNEAYMEKLHEVSRWLIS